MRIMVDVNPGTMITEIREWFDQNPDFDHRMFPVTDVVKLQEIMDIIMDKKRKAGYKV